MSEILINQRRILPLRPQDIRRRASSCFAVAYFLHNFINLKTSSPKNQIIYGRNPVMEALEAGQYMERIYLKSGVTGEWVKKLRSYCQEMDISIKRVPLIKLDKLTRNKNHQGIVAYTSLIHYQKLDDVIPFLFEQGKAPVIMMLDNITDVRNIGAISRSIEVLGADVMILSGRNAGMLNEDAVKTSAGALSKITICRRPDTLATIELLHSYGIHTFASVMKDSMPIQNQDFTIPSCIILGNEGDGISEDVMKICSQSIAIPQLGKTDSLNVSVAAGITLYEIMRQRSETS